MDEHEATSRNAWRAIATADRFDNYQEIAARYASAGTCGHAIAKGDKIGWNRRHGTRCSACWSRWSAENAAADADERFMGGNY